LPELIARLIDVFADKPLTGNPLAVVQAADKLSEEQMRRLAGEFNPAETTFILRSTRADRKLRSFTASSAEIFGAGNNSLGAWRLSRRTQRSHDRQARDGLNSSD
jgi:PhzF family phenazine biosynthesis protein